jgi:hypothetical protein
MDRGAGAGVPTRSALDMSESPARSQVTATMVKATGRSRTLHHLGGDRLVPPGSSSGRRVSVLPAAFSSHLRGVRPGGRGPDAGAPVPGQHRPWQVT